MNDQLYCLELDGEAASSAAAFEMLDAGGFQYSAQTEAGTGVTNYIFYTESEAELKGLAAKVEASRPVWAANGVSFGPAKLSSLKKEDWTEVWKQYFKVQRISPTLVIKASWLEHVQERPDEVVVEIDPGMSFGTGSHETTQYCLKTIEELAARSRPSTSTRNAWSPPARTWSATSSRPPASRSSPATPTTSTPASFTTWWSPTSSPGR